MKTLYKAGNTITLTAPYDVLSGAGLLVGSIFGIAANDALSGAGIETVVAGVYEINKTLADTPSQGGAAYWDNTAKEVTTTSTANTLIGVFIDAALNGDATVNVRLNGSF